MVAVPFIVAAALLTPAWVVNKQNEQVNREIQVSVCHEHETLMTLKKIGQRLGIPVKDIIVPSIEGLDCAP